MYDKPNFNFFTHFLRHYMMMTCWKENPEDRPTFQDLVITITTILKPLADYMDFSDVYTAIRR